MADQAKMVPLNNDEISLKEERLEIGNTVYLIQAYFDDHRVSIAEVPKFGWTVAGVIDNIIQVQYTRETIKLISVLMVDKKYLKHLL